MDAQAILTKIEQDAKDAARKVLADAEEKAGTMKRDAQAKLAALEKAMLAQAEQESVQLEERMQRMTDLDDRKTLLALKREVIGEAFRAAKDKLVQTSPAQRRSFYLRETVKCAAGEETLIAGADGADWFDGEFLPDANKALLKAGKPGNLKLSDERRPAVAGVILSRNGAEIHITFDSMMDEARAELEQLAARELFTE